MRQKKQLSLSDDIVELTQKYYTSAIHYLTIRPRSEKEVRDNLYKKNAPAEMIEEIIKTLKKQKFLNDNEFARWFKEQRDKYRPKSDKVVKLELRQKGISQEIIEEVFSEVGEEVLTDIEKAKILVEKKISKYKDLPRQEIYQKMGGFLARRGFGWDTIKTAIDDILTKSYNTK